VRRAVAFGSGSFLSRGRTDLPGVLCFVPFKLTQMFRSFGMKLCVVLFWGLLQISALSCRGDLQEIVLFGSVLVYVAF
jgi:hypothetical protein